MKTKMQSTSLIAYKDLKNTIGAKQKTVLTMLFNLISATNTELAEALNWPINCVTGRVNELVKQHLVKELDKVKCTSTGRTVIEWIPTTEEEYKALNSNQGQGELFK